MEIYQALILGIVQGLTEFLPVSSSGHLVLLQNFFGLTEPELLFDISLHIGTLVAVFIVFFKEIRDLVLTLGRLPGLLESAGGGSKLFAENENFRLLVLIVIGSVPTAVLGLLFHRMADRLFGSVALAGIMLLITGTLLWLTRRIGRSGRTRQRMTVKDTLLVGLVQGLAVMPGISRSGSTIATALFLGIDRKTAGRFSFLLSIPAIFGALLVGFDAGKIHSAALPASLFIGTAAAAIVGVGALKALLRLVDTGHFYLFAPYCWLIGLVAIIAGA